MSRNRLSYEYEPEVDPVDACTTEYEMMQYYNCTISSWECEQLISRISQRYQNEMDGRLSHIQTADEERAARERLEMYMLNGKIFREALDTILQDNGYAYSDMMRLGINLNVNDTILGRLYGDYSFDIFNCPAIKTAFEALKQEKRIAVEKQLHKYEHKLHKIYAEKSGKLKYLDRLKNQRFSKIITGTYVPAYLSGKIKDVELEVFNITLRIEALCDTIKSLRDEIEKLK